MFALLVPDAEPSRDTLRAAGVRCVMRKDILVVIAAGFHLFPFRTEKLSPPAPMVLRCDAGE